ncbi:MAG: ferrous iron transport protein B [Candidatus Wallbacteria bacterium HGW-Wallbacteria-1]|jgi:ferrous iron transport protein B|uniref:Ferrous iron transport protein B n=1 Tax=Candidatus Wallbacteria bacterium HGW-Wallbacteria-1 TaxID=2013854 RepID=A0A2N1PPY4_9BACT|nr:MAG: ferrous iron transport protein B [Candidatus Wallbacteria bacterium HGW-Wallbacteria-1]
MRIKMNRKLSTFKPSEKGIVTRILGTGEARRRLMDVGVNRGCPVEVIRVAPMGDPIEISIGTMRLSLRRSEAELIVVAPEKNLPGHRKADAPPVIALAGNPNCGKTATFNQLCGANQRVGNWPGVTVERVEGTLTNSSLNARIIDLPGIYSLTPYSEDEMISRRFLLGENPDLIVNVVDSTNLERSLCLTLQLMELEIPMILAMNLQDEAEKEGITIDFNGLSKLLGIPVIPCVATGPRGIENLRRAIDRNFSEVSTDKPGCKVIYSRNLERILTEISEMMGRDQEISHKINPRWLAVKLLEGDDHVFRLLHERTIWLTLEPVIHRAQNEVMGFYDGESETYVADERLSFIRGCIRECVKTRKRHPSDTGRYSTSDALDNFLLHRFVGLPIFIAVLATVFGLTFTIGQFPSHWLELFFEWLKTLASLHISSPMAQSVVVDGVLSGVGGVVVFLPNILILFICLSFLEDCGYMSRITFLLDSFMHRIGLHGRSFLPMIMGFGCSVPALLSCRTLKNRGDRLTTMLVIPLMSCGARFPVYILLASIFFGTMSGWKAAALTMGVYLFGVLLALIMAFIFKKSLFSGLSEPFVMELPPYRFPTLRSVLMTGLHSCVMYLKKAGTVILGAAIVMWFLLNFPNQPHLNGEMSPEIAQNRIESSYAGMLGKFMEPAIRPLGFDWRIGLSLISGLAAKEVVVSTMGVIYASGSDSPESLRETLARRKDFTPLTALTMMIFVLIYIPCLSTVAVFHREAGQFRWTALLLTYTTLLAWIISFGCYRTGLLLGM